MRFELCQTWFQSPRAFNYHTLPVMFSFCWPPKLWGEVEKSQPNDVGVITFPTRDKNGHPMLCHLPKTHHLNFWSQDKTLIRRHCCPWGWQFLFETPTSAIFLIKDYWPHSFMSIVRTQEGAALQCYSASIITHHGNWAPLMEAFLISSTYRALYVSPKPLFIQFIRIALWMNFKTSLTI